MKQLLRNYYAKSSTDVLSALLFFFERRRQWRIVVFAAAPSSRRAEWSAPPAREAPRKNLGEGVIGMVTLNIWEILVAFVVAMGIPSAIMGVIVRRLEKRIAKRDEAREAKDAAQEELLLLIVQSNGAAIALGEATARAVQRIPDAHCNGDMHDALEYATSIKHKQKDFLAKQGIHALQDK